MCGQQKACQHSGNLLDSSEHIGAGKVSLYWISVVSQGRSTWVWHQKALSLFISAEAQHEQRLFRNTLHSVVVTLAESAGRDVWWKKFTT